MSLDWQQRVNSVLSRSLTKYHYVDQRIDNAFSKRVYTLFIEQIDPNKHFFTQDVLDELDAYTYQVDNDILGNTFYFYNALMAAYKKQQTLVQSMAMDILSVPIDINNPLQLETDIDKRGYVKNADELRNRWRATIQYYMVGHYMDLYREGDPSANELVIDSDRIVASQSKTARDLERRFRRLGSKDDSDYFEMYLNTIAQAFGPHTTYLPPEEKADFDINMSGQLEGIGAVLQEDDGYITVTRIIPGSAADRQGELAVKDTLLKVAPLPDAEAVSVIEMPVKDAVMLIRGAKGSTVVLTVKKIDGMVQTISVVRDVVEIESTYAKSGVFTTPNQAIGYIYLPSFYRDFDNDDNRNAANDVKQALRAFDKAGVDGVILDLRNNGGGSLKDAVDIAGFFIEEGPIVQVSDGYRGAQVYRDEDPQIWSAVPMVVLVNTFSASASEIVSAALQDYERAIIMGDKHTFGKGTVQKVVNLDRFLARSQDPLGFLKITIQQYFRITGDTTQFKGVIPDIIYPSPYDHMAVGEKELDYPIEGGRIRPVSYARWVHPSFKSSVVIQHANDRLRQQSVTRVIEDYNAFMTNQRAISYQSVRLTDTWNTMQRVKSANESLKTLAVDTRYTSYKPIMPAADTTSDTELYRNWVDGFKTDVVLNDAFVVLAEMGARRDG